MKKFALPICLLISILILSVIYRLFFVLTPTIQWKIYNNSFYHFSLQIPSDWSVKTSYDNTSYKLPTFQLNSPDNTITIQNFSASQSNRTEDSNHISTMKIGHYSMERVIRMEGDGVLDDWVNFDFPRQRPFTLFFLYAYKDIHETAILNKILLSFHFTQQEKNIDELITYNIPYGFKKVSSSDNTKTVLLQTPNAIRDPGSSNMQKGANITITDYPIGPNGKFYEDTFVNDIVTTANIGGLTGKHISSCYEGCSESYEVKHGEYYWIFNFADSTSFSPEAFKTAPYQPSVDKFIKSLTFK